MNVAFEHAPHFICLKCHYSLWNELLFPNWSTACFCFIPCFRFIGSTKVSLKDLASGQVRSLPSKNLPLANESGQNIGVSFFLPADIILQYRGVFA